MRRRPWNGAAVAAGLYSDDIVHGAIEGNPAFLVKGNMVEGSLDGNLRRAVQEGVRLSDERIRNRVRV